MNHRYLPIILILVFSCSVAWGSWTKICAICLEQFVHNDPEDQSVCGPCRELIKWGKKAYTFKDGTNAKIIILQKEIQLLKDRITELEKANAGCGHYIEDVQALVLEGYIFRNNSWSKANKARDTLK